MRIIDDRQGGVRDERWGKRQGGARDESRGREIWGAERRDTQGITRGERLGDARDARHGGQEARETTERGREERERDR